MPHVLHRRLELGQDEGAAAQEAFELSSQSSPSFRSQMP
jgi:hypothetical protein